MKNYLNWLLLILLALIWGSSFILMKRALFSGNGSEIFSATQVASLRIGIAFLVMLPVAIRYRHLFTGPFWVFLLAVGLFGNTFPAFLFTAAQVHISSSLAGMLNSLTPIFTLLIALFIFKVRITKRQILGILIGFAGAVGLVLFSDGIATSPRMLPYASLVVIATICYAISLNIIKNRLGPIPSIQITAVALAFVGPFGLGYLALTDFPQRMISHPEAGTALLAAATLAVLGTAVALIIFNQVVKNSTAVFASSVTYLIPVVALGWGVYDGEGITFWQIISGVITLAGIFLVNRK